MKPSTRREKLKDQNARLMPIRYQYALTLREQGLTNADIAKVLRCNIYTVSKMIKAAHEANEGMAPTYSHYKRDEHKRPLDKTPQALQATETPAPIAEPIRPAFITPSGCNKTYEIVFTPQADGRRQLDVGNEVHKGYFGRFIDTCSSFWTR